MVIDPYSEPFNYWILTRGRVNSWAGFSESSTTSMKDSLSYPRAVGSCVRSLPDWPMLTMNWARDWTESLDIEIELPTLPWSHRADINHPRFRHNEWLTIRSLWAFLCSWVLIYWAPWGDIPSLSDFTGISSIPSHEIYPGRKTYALLMSLVSTSLVKSVCSPIHFSRVP